MHKRTTSHLIGFLGMLCVAGSAGADAGSMNKADFKAAEKQIEAQYKADRKACGLVKKGNARDICVAKAKGKEGVAHARLDAEYEPSPQAERLVKDAEADADYEVAKERCDDARGQARKVCVEQAEAALEAALRQAKVEKVDRINGLKAKERQRLRISSRG